MGFNQSKMEASHSRKTNSLSAAMLFGLMNFPASSARDHSRRGDKASSMVQIATKVATYERMLKDCDQDQTACEKLHNQGRTSCEYIEQSERCKREIKGFVHEMGKDAHEGDEENHVTRCQQQTANCEAAEDRRFQEAASNLAAAGNLEQSDPYSPLQQSLMRKSVESYERELTFGTGTEISLERFRIAARERCQALSLEARKACEARDQASFEEAKRRLA